MAAKEERKIILDLAVTLDGLIEGPNGEVDWCIMDDEMDFPKFLDGIDTILYGRKSFDAWGQFSPESESAPAEKELWESVHAKKKFVFSRTQKGEQSGALFLNGSISEEVAKLKKEPGKDMWLYGGASLITSFVNEGLVDEYRLSVHPVVLGEGKPLFIDISQRVPLELADTRIFSSGVVQLIYRSKNGGRKPPGR